MIRERRLETAALVAVAALAGCGGGGHKQSTATPGPRLPPALATELASSSDDVARKLDAGDGCGALAAAQDLRRRTIAAINARQVPAALQEPLTAAASGIVARIQCTPPPPEQPGNVNGNGEGRGQGKGHGKGHGKHGGEGD
jgi:hypothetical protein